ncbi:hypothetical protein [Nocardia sp. NPDC057227]|uniref:hypothetical protein n=1 Tax=Nocardia sp. NPDC057227 TaxID=3346056 RepID=UPI00362BF307
MTYPDLGSVLLRVQTRDGRRVSLSTDGARIRIRVHKSMPAGTPEWWLDFEPDDADVLAAALATRHHPRCTRGLARRRAARRARRT